MKALVGECYHRTWPQAARLYHEFIWVADASGNVQFVVDLEGLPSWIETRPYSGVSADYDVTVLDVAGGDVLLGLGANRSASDTQMAFISAAATGPAELRRCVRGPHTFTVAAAGAGATGLALLALIPAAFLQHPQPRVLLH